MPTTHMVMENASRCPSIWHKAIKKPCLLLFPLALITNGCNDLLDIDPPREKVDSEIVFSSDVTAVSAMTGIYHALMAPTAFASGNLQSVTSLAGMSADELVFNNARWNSADLFGFNQNNILPDNQYVEGLWASLYKSIYGSNSLIEGLANSRSISPSIANQLRGEALVIRAFCYFYAVNLFGEVPLVTTTDRRINSKIVRSDGEAIYQQIVADLKEAKSLLSENYFMSLNMSATDRVRINKYAAAALLARVYLYRQEWSNAETEASLIIDNSNLYELNTDVANVFLASTASNPNKEVIWQLMPVASSSSNVNTWEGNYFIINNTNLTSYRFTLSNTLKSAFESSDSRLAKWIGSVDPGNGVILYFPYKYKIKNGGPPLKEYSMVLRLAEQFLIRAEARTMLGDLSGAQRDINAIRNRASLDNTTADDQASLLSAIENERRVELFSEWGHRWLDLKRLRRSDVVLAALKSETWQSTDTLYPLPQNELDLNSNLKPQNSGY